MKIFLNLCFCLLLTNFASAQLQKVSWEATLEKGDSDEYTLVLNGTIEPGWYLYSQYLESDEGPIATKVVLNETEGMERIGKTEESGHKIEGYDNIFLMNITKYKEDVTFKQRLKLPKDAAFVSGIITFMTCDEEQCLPPTEVEFTAELED